MFCENCHARTANVHIMKIMNGEKTEIHLCNECAVKENRMHTYTNISRNIFNSLSDEGFLFPYRSINFADIFKHRQDNTGNIESGGLPGSESDYKKFRNNLKNALNKHYKNTTAEKFSKESEEDPVLFDLKKQLKECIEKENFEKAAQLRDKIKEYKEKHSTK